VIVDEKDEPEFGLGFKVGGIGPFEAVKPVGLGPLDKVTETTGDERLAGMFPMFSTV